MKLSGLERHKQTGIVEFVAISFESHLLYQVHEPPLPGAEVGHRRHHEPSLRWAPWTYW